MFTENVRIYGDSHFIFYPADPHRLSDYRSVADIHSIRFDVIHSTPYYYYYLFISPPNDVSQFGVTCGQGALVQITDVAQLYILPLQPTDVAT